VLKARLISAAIMVPLVVCGVLYLSTDVFALMLGAVLLAGLWEWGRLIPLTGLTGRIIYMAVVAGLLLLLWRTGPGQWINLLLPVALGWWVCALFWLSRPALFSQGTPTGISMKILAGVLVIVPAWAALFVLHSYESGGPKLTLMLLVMIWLADSGAYFAGKQWGHTRLAPGISPGKTREGVYGGLLASLLFAAVAGWLYSHSFEWTLTFMLVSLLAMMFSVVGDLVESLMKRQSGIKDSGNIIPGHGGIFDRIDSLVAAAPLFLAGFIWLGLEA
jgi:phosphatidate cytidylyltransferase